MAMAMAIPLVAMAMPTFRRFPADEDSEHSYTHFVTSLCKIHNL
jgi:hypothetical protein